MAKPVKSKAVDTSTTTAPKCFWVAESKSENRSWVLFDNGYSPVEESYIINASEMTVESAMEQCAAICSDHNISDELHLIRINPEQIVKVKRRIGVEVVK